MKATDFFDLEKTIADRLILSADYPWDALAMLEEYIYRVGRALDKRIYEEVRRGIWIAKGASVSESCDLIAPIIIGENVEVDGLCRIGGSVMIGNGAVVGRGSEIKRSVILDGAVLAQNNYVSYSIIGYRSRLSSGAIVSSQRADRRDIVSSFGEGEIRCPHKRFGAIVGDLAVVGASSVISAGSVIEKRAKIAPLTRARGYVCASELYHGERITADIL